MQTRLWQTDAGGARSARAEAASRPASPLTPQAKAEPCPARFREPDPCYLTQPWTVPDLRTGGAMQWNSAVLVVRLN